MDGRQQRDTLAYHLTEHLRLPGVYWGLTAISLLGRPDALPRQEMIDWVMSCWDDDVGAPRPMLSCGQAELNGSQEASARIPGTTRISTPRSARSRSS